MGSEWLALLLSFIVPVLVRWVPESKFPYPIGFDTPLYLSWGRHYTSNPVVFPLMVPLLGGLYLLGFDLVTVMKYLPTLVYGLLGVSVFLFSRLCLNWRLEKSLLVVFLIAFSFPMLRVSWDMHKQFIATAFLVLAFSWLKTIETPLGFVAFAVSSFLAAFSHDVLFAVLMVVCSYVFLVEVRRNRKRAILISVVTLSILLIFIGVWYGWNFGLIVKNGVGGIVLDTSSLFDRWTWEVNKNLFEFFQICGLFVPLVVLGFFKDEVLFPWLILGLLGSFSTILFPFRAPSINPSRWMLLLACPFSFYMANGLDRLTLITRKSLKKMVALFFVVFIINFPSWGFLGFFPQPSLYYKPGLLPLTMASSSAPLDDIDATIWLVRRFNDVGGEALLVHGNYFGWASYYTDKIVVTFGELYGGDRSIKDALKIAQNSGNIDVYLLWYVDGDAFSLSFIKVAERGPMKLYRYVGS